MKTTNKDLDRALAHALTTAVDNLITDMLILRVELDNYQRTFTKKMLKKLRRVKALARQL